MNNNMPNNNNGNGNDLNSVSLGSIDVGNVNNIPPVPPVESLNTENTVPNTTIPTVEATPTTPTEQSQVTPIDNPVSTVEQAPVQTDTTVNSVPPVEPIQPVSPVEPVSTIPPVEPIPPVQPVNYDVPEAMNTFNTTPVFNEIGTVPPIPNTPIIEPTMNTTPESPKQPKKKNKMVFVLIIVLLIGAVGVGVYIFLNMSNSSTPKVVVTPKEVVIEAGSEVSTNIDDYATFSGIASSSCSLDTSAITDTNVAGNEYTFTITCNNVNYSGTAKIVDTTAPVAVLQQVTVQVGSEVTPEDFIDNCTDASGACTYEFSDPDTVAGYLATAANYHVDIIVKDSVGNEETVTGTLIVTDDVVPDMYLSCTMNDEVIRFSMMENALSGDITRSYTFTFNNVEDYNAYKSANQDSSEVTYQNITGVPSFDDASTSLILTQTLTKQELDREEGRTLPTAYGELRAYYVGEGYTCSIERP